MSDVHNNAWIVPVLRDVKAYLMENGLDEGSLALTQAMAVIQRDIRRFNCRDGLTGLQPRPNHRPSPPRCHLRLVTSKT